ncbi:MAG: hypothetical protein ACTSX9_00690 [Candidatus Njordarchaeales archaeon]
MKINVIEEKTFCGNVVEEKIDAVSINRRETILQGIINLPNPCYKVLVSYEVINDCLDIKIKLEYSGEICVQCIAVKKFEIRITGIPEKIKVINVLCKGKVLLRKNIP